MQKYEKEVALAKQEADKLTVALNEVRVIKTEVGFVQAGTFLIAVKDASRKIASKKDPIIKSLNLAIKEVRDLFREPEERLSNAERTVKNSMLQYQEKLAAKAATASQKIEQKVDAGEMKLSEGVGKLANVKQAPTVVQTDKGKVQFKVIKKIRIVNSAELPAKYLIRDRVLEAFRLEVAEDVRNGDPVPAGAEEYEEKVVAGGY